MRQPAIKQQRRIAFMMFVLVASFASSQGGPSEYLQKEEVLDLLQQGKLWCIDYRSDDVTCKSVHRIVIVRRSEVLVEGIRVNWDYSRKITDLAKFDLNDEGLCQTPTEEWVNSFNSYRTTNRIAHIVSSDELISGDDRLTRLRDRVKESLQQVFGETICTRYQVVERDANGAIRAIEAHRFADGIRQPAGSWQPIRITLFEPDRKDLLLRHVPPEEE